MSHFTYILECRDKTLYTGYTNDLVKRLFDHNNSKQGARYTKQRRPVKLLYCEHFATKSEALKREIHIKRLSREEKLKLMISFLPSSRPPRQRRRPRTLRQKRPVRNKTASRRA